MRQEDVMRVLGTEWRSASELASELESRPERHKVASTRTRDALRVLKKYGLVESRSVIIGNRLVMQWRRTDGEEARLAPSEDDGGQVQGAQAHPALQGQGDVLPGDGMGRPCRAVERSARNNER